MKKTIKLRTETNTRSIEADIHQYKGIWIAIHENVDFLCEEGDDFKASDLMTGAGIGACAQTLGEALRIAQDKIDAVGLEKYKIVQDKFILKYGAINETPTP